MAVLLTPLKNLHCSLHGFFSGSLKKKSTLAYKVDFTSSVHWAPCTNQVYRELPQATELNVLY